MQRVLITGGCGFIGANVAIHLAASFDKLEVVCLDNLYRRGSELNLQRLAHAGISFHYGDVRDPASFPLGRFDALIECSAEPSVLAGQQDSPDYLINTNLIGLYHCLEFSRKSGARLIFLSTSRVYPVRPLERHPFEETQSRFQWLDKGTPGISSSGVSETIDMSGPRSLYGFTKFSGEQLIDEYRANFGVQALVNRCGMIAGPWQFGKVDQGLVAHWVFSHIFDRPISYIGYGGLGKQVRDVLHIRDLCDLVELQLRYFDSWDGWVGNVSGGPDGSLSLIELTGMCNDATGKVLPIRRIFETRPFDLRIYVGDCTKLFDHSAWRPRRSIRSLVDDVACWAWDNADVIERLL